MRLRLALTVAVVALVAVAAPATAAPALHRTAPMHELPGFSVIEATSVKVVTTPDRATVTVKTADLVSGNAYTLWSFSFSNPGECDFGDAALGTLCGFGDDSADDTGFVVQQVAGHLVGNGANANFGGSIAVENASGAEYHMVVADHGPAGSGPGLPDQIQTPGPGVQIGFIVP